MHPGVRSVDGSVSIHARIHTHKYTLLALIMVIALNECYKQTHRHRACNQQINEQLVRQSGLAILGHYNNRKADKQTDRMQSRTRL